MNNQRTIVLRLSEAQYQAIKIRAFYEGQTMSAIIRNAIQTHVKPVSKQDQREEGKHR